MSLSFRENRLCNIEWDPDPRSQRFFQFCALLGKKFAASFEEPRVEIYHPVSLLVNTIVFQRLLWTVSYYWIVDSFDEAVASNGESARDASQAVKTALVLTHNLP